MKINRNFLFASMAALTLLASCSDDEVATFTPSVTINKPAALASNTFTWKEGTMVLKEINTNQETKVTLPFASFPAVNAGQYNITVEGTVEYTSESYDEEGNATTITSNAAVRGSKENVTINSNGADLSLDLMIYNNESSFVLGEIYVTGSLNAAGTSGILGDKFFKIYNNSNKVQYADGLALLESAITTVNNFTYTPDFRQEGFGTWAIYVIPGNGTQHPVNPGEYIIVADQASNHNATNSNALDMSGADFEWYDYTDKGMDTDNPEVENLDRWYCYTATIWTPATQANRAFAIARIPIEKETFINTTGEYYHDDWSYVNSGKTMYQKGYQIKNEWVLDAVNLAPSTTFTKLATSVALDKSFISIAAKGDDKTRFGKSIIRKSAGEMKDENGKTYTVLLDTDDSANDFSVATVSLKK